MGLCGLSLSLFVAACTDSNELENLKGLSSPSVVSRTAGDGVYDVLGYGYDITSDYLGVSAVRQPILDIKAFVRDNQERFDNPFIGVISQRISAGEDAQSFLQQVITNSNFTGSVAAMGITDTSKGFFSGTITTGFKTDSKYSYSSKYSFARAEVLKKQRQYLLYTNVGTLSRYLSSKFVADLNQYSADEIVKMYGTHVLTNVTVGGSYKAYYKSAIVEETSRIEKTKTVTAGAKYNMVKVGLDANGTWNTTTITETNKKNSNWLCYIESIGGSTSGTSITLSPNQGPTITVNLGSWTQSVDDTHSRLVDVDWNATYPIYDLVSDPIKKAALKIAVEKYIDSSKLEILELLPLYAYYSSKHINNSYFTQWKGTHFNTDDYQGVVCYLCKKQVPGTTPLYEYYSSKYINHSLSSIWRGNQSNTDVYQGITGYIYTSQLPGTVPLYEYYSAKHINHSYCIEWKGNRFNTDDFQKIIGYVFPFKD